MFSDRASSAAHALVSTLPQRATTGILGALSRVTLPRGLRGPLWKLYATAVGALPDEAARPLGEYERFEDFFTRELKSGVRRFPTDPEAWGSPCDGRVAASGRVRDGKMIQAKGIGYEAAELVVDTEFEPQLYTTIYLSPADYHRVHYPCSARLLSATHVGGQLWPVASFVVEREEGVFVRNERVVVHFVDGLGRRAAIVLVAAFGVGNIIMYDPELDTEFSRRSGVRTAHFDRGVCVGRGNECGAFALGSTVIVLVDDRSAPLQLAVQEGERVLLGERLFWA